MSTAFSIFFSQFDLFFDLVLTCVFRMLAYFTSSKTEKQVLLSQFFFVCEAYCGKRPFAPQQMVTNAQIASIQNRLPLPPR